MKRGYLTPPVVIALALITLFAAAAIFFNTFLLKGLKKEPTPVSTPTIQPSPKSATDETANWKTYTNTQLGFSMKYPPLWLIYDNNTPPCKGGIPEFVFFNRPKRGALKDCHFADVLPADFYVYVGEPFNPLPTTNEYDTFTPFRISEEDGVINFRTEKSEGPRRKDTLIDVNHNGRGYEISFPNTNYKGDHEPIYDQILSTFKFLD